MTEKLNLNLKILFFLSGTISSGRIMWYPGNRGIIQGINATLQTPGM